MLLKSDQGEIEITKERMEKIEMLALKSDQGEIEIALRKESQDYITKLKSDQGEIEMVDLIVCENMDKYVEIRSR